MHRAHVGDLEQTLPLFRGQAAFDSEFTFEFVYLSSGCLAVRAIRRVDLCMSDPDRC